MVKIYLVRHGQTDWNLEKRNQGTKPIPLNKIGRKQAKELGEKLKNLKIKAIYSSPNPRAFQTAEEIAKHHKGLKIIKVKGISERCFGEIEGLTVEERLKSIPDIEEQWKKEGFDWKPPKGESINEFQGNVIKAFKKIIEKHKNENILIVTHGGVIRTILIYLKNVSIDCFFELRNPKNCEVIVIDWDGKKAVFDYE